MCKLEICPACLRSTWSGCGQHVDAVLQGTAPASRCVASSERDVERYGQDALLKAACIRVLNNSGRSAAAGAPQSDNMLEARLNSKHVDGSLQVLEVELASLATQLQISIGIAHTNAPTGTPLHWSEPNISVSLPAVARRCAYVLSMGSPSAPHFVRLQHFDGRLTFAEAAERPILDGMVLRLADAFRQKASRPAPQQQWVKCSQGDNFGCGAVFLKEDFEKHCGEVEHSDDFAYVTEPVDPPSGSC